MSAASTLVGLAGVACRAERPRTGSSTSWSACALPARRHPARLAAVDGDLEGRPRASTRHSSRHSMNGIGATSTRRRRLPRDHRHPGAGRPRHLDRRPDRRCSTADLPGRVRPRQRLAKAVTFFVDVMTGIPSIVAGLFILSVLDPASSASSYSGFAGALALAILMMPVGGPLHRGDAQAGPERAARGLAGPRRAEVAHDPQGRPADRDRRHHHRRHAGRRPHHGRDRPAAAAGLRHRSRSTPTRSRAPGVAAALHLRAVPAGNDAVLRPGLGRGARR